VGEPGEAPSDQQYAQHLREVGRLGDQVAQSQQPQAGDHLINRTRIDLDVDEHHHQRVSPSVAERCRVVRAGRDRQRAVLIDQRKDSHRGADCDDDDHRRSGQLIDVLEQPVQSQGHEQRSRSTLNRSLVRSETA
jgi:hypothetical protein